jgi:hypothetical protein
MQIRAFHKGGPNGFIAFRTTVSRELSDRSYAALQVAQAIFYFCVKFMADI